jgi:glycosyltransferase involved in cell wall biosynthesis
MGLEVSIAAPSCGPDDINAMALQSGAAELIYFPAISRGALIVSPKLVQWVKKNAGRFDIIHAHGLFNPVSSLCIRAAREAGRAVVVCPHGTLSRYTLAHRRSLLKRTYLTLIERTNIEKASAIHFTTLTELDEARWHGVDFGNRAHVVPPPVLHDHAADLPRKPLDDPPTVLFLSRIHPVKNVDGLLKAWQHVLASVPNARLVVAGPGNAGVLQSLKRLAVSVGVSDSVTFLGFLGPEEKARHFSAARVLVLPSHHENFGVVVLEAVAAGLPVVISPEVQLAPFVERHRLGVIAKREPQEFAAGIISAIRDLSLQSRVASLGSELARQFYSPQAVGEDLMRMYYSAQSTSI